MEQFEKAANEIVKQEELNRFGDNITKYNMKTVIWELVTVVIVYMMY